MKNVLIKYSLGISFLTILTMFVVGCEKREVHQHQQEEQKPYCRIDHNLITGDIPKIVSPEKFKIVNGVFVYTYDSGDTLVLNNWHMVRCVGVDVSKNIN